MSPTYGSFSTKPLVSDEISSPPSHSNYSLKPLFFFLLAISAIIVVSLSDFDSTSSNLRPSSFFQECRTADYVESDLKCNFKQYPVGFGSDVVAYRSLSFGDAAIQGSEEFSTTFSGYLFYFANQENLQVFLKDPLKYIPSWGGYCAYGISAEIKDQGQLFAVKSDPNQWAIVDDRLFLFRGSEARDMFVEQQDDLILSGDTLWSRWFHTCTGFFYTQCNS